MIEIGTLLGNRYEIIKKIGAGGMSVVYKAKCQKLNRYVAVKVLREEFVDDETFATKFRVEAQAAASLSHPNIINVFDVGSEDDIHYIVMEYIEGVTLKEYIRQNGPLSSKETLEIAKKIADALRVAHANKIVHRDIKPQNIIISDKGDVKVTDFGIARAASTSTITSNANAIGSVHYFSPEQARGGYVDEKSDLYSLGITMYEMITNTLPFQADSPVSVAIQQIKEELPAPSSINKSIWNSLESIIIKSTQKKPERRYQTAEVLINDIDRAIADPSYSITNDYVSMDDSPTINISSEELNKIKEEVKDYDGNINFQREETNREEKSSDKIIVISAIVTSVIIIGLLLFAGISFVNSLGNDEPTIVMVQVPNIVGKSVDEAETILNNSGLLLEVTDEIYSNKYEKGIILSQTPQIIEKLEEGSIVKVTVSKGEELVKVPDTSGMDYEEARDLLKQNGFNVEMKSSYDDIIEVGYVITQEPKAGSSIEKGNKVTIIVSQGKEVKTVIVPKVKGLTESEAIAKLNNAGLEVGQTVYYYSDEPEGIVISQNVEAGSEVNEGYVVDLSLSKGPEPETDDTQTGPEDDTSDTQTDPDDNNDDVKDIKTKIIEITNILSDDVQSAKLTVILQDTNNKMVLYNQEVSKESFPLKLEAQGKDNATIQIYLNGILFSEDEITF